jgi:hypothetical protein
MLITLEASLTRDHQEPPEISSRGFLRFYKHMRVPVFANVIETGADERVKYVFGLKPDDITLEAFKEGTYDASPLSLEATCSDYEPSLGACIRGCLY